MSLYIRMIFSGLCLLATLTVARAQENCDVESKNCTCAMPKLYECPEVNLNLIPVDGCQLLRDKLAGPEFSNLTCGVNNTYSPMSNDGVLFKSADGKWLEFENGACEDDFYFIVDLDGGQLVKTLKLEDINRDATADKEVFFEFAYGYTVPCTDQPTINTLLWQYITPGWYADGTNITEVWNRLNFTDGVFQHSESTYFKAAYLFIHFNHVPITSRFKLSMTGCHEEAKDIDPALDYLNNLLSVTNDTLEVADGIAVSGTVLDQEHGLTTDEVVLFLDAFTRLGDEPVDLSNQTERAKNLTQGLAVVASKVLDSISQANLSVYDNSDTHVSTPAGPYTAAGNSETIDTSDNPDKRVADQQATAILTIEKAIGVITSNAGDATIVAKTENIIIVSAPVRINDSTTTQPINLPGSDPADGSGEGSEDATVEASVDLSDIARLLDDTGSSNTNTRVRFTALQIKSDELLNTSQNVNFDVSSTLREDEKFLSSQVLLNSDILSLTVYVNGTAKSVPVEAQYTNKQPVDSTKHSTFHRNKSSTCVWLTENKTWSDTGCSTDITDAQNTDCSCDHTTSFAVLVQVVDFEISKANDLALTILSYFGIGLSILCLVIALFIFFTVGALRTSERNMIHRNLMIALLLAYIVFLAGVEYAKDIKIVCTIVAALLHYLYLTVFGWMLIEGIHLYLMLVKVFGSEGSKQIYYLLIGWGAPVIIVIISVGIKHEEYGTTDMCWFQPGSSVIYAFVGPVIAVILFNFLVLCMVLRIIYRSSAISVDCPIDQVKAAAKGSIALLPILGLTWCLGMFAVNRETIVFQYLFVICNSTQGILLFVFHCLFNSEVRNALKREQEKMGWSTAGTQSKKNKVHPEDTGHSTAKGLTTKGATKSTGAEEKSVMVYNSAQDPSGKGPTAVQETAGKAKAGPKRTSHEFSLPGQMDESLDEAQTSTIRQEIKTEREMEQGGWKINEKKHVQRTFVRVEDSQ